MILSARPAFFMTKVRSTTMLAEFANTNIHKCILFMLNILLFVSACDMAIKRRRGGGGVSYFCHFLGTISIENSFPVASHLFLPF